MSTELTTEAEPKPRSNNPIAKVKHELSERIQSIEKALPDYCAGQAERLITRAVMTFNRNENLQKCTIQSFVACVIEAAESGLPIDGKLCHAVPYGTTATAIVDYKGLIAIARRSGHLANVYADVVCEHDSFSHGRTGPTCELKHTYQHNAERGEMEAAYAVLVFPDGSWQYELMQKDEIDAIRKRAKSKSGPWNTDYNEMAKKTVIRRGLKHYCDDERLSTAMDMSDREFQPWEQERPRGVSRSKLNDKGQ